MRLAATPAGVATFDDWVAARDGERDLRSPSGRSGVVEARPRPPRGVVVVRRPPAMARAVQRRDGARRLRQR
jgi:hypothetical protein